MPSDQLITPARRDATQDWWQAYIQLTPPDMANVTASEHAAVSYLAPLLDQAHEDGLITSWWFIRKHPCWRLRLQLPRGHAGAAVPAALDDLTASGAIYRWWPGIYEAEEAAFGGLDAMTAAHYLFAADTQGIMGLLGGAPFGLGRRELSIILCSALLCGAGLEWYEQGDAWHRVTRERPFPSDVQHEQITKLASTIRTLLGTDTSADSLLFQADGPIANGAQWAGSFRQTGKTLGDLARSGTLQRGLREVLSYHIIFHWNRLGLTARQQSILARAARDAILGPVPGAGAGTLAMADRDDVGDQPHVATVTHKSGVAGAS